VNVEMMRLKEYTCTRLKPLYISNVYKECIRDCRAIFDALRRITAVILGYLINLEVQQVVARRGSQSTKDAKEL
jgi:hypothetical protein